MADATPTAAEEPTLDPVEPITATDEAAGTGAAAPEWVDDGKAQQPLVEAPAEAPAEAPPAPEPGSGALN